jgi:integrase
MTSSTRILREIYEHEYAVLATHSEACRKQYRMTLDRWGGVLGHEPTVDDLDDLVVQRYLAVRRQTVKAATCRKDRNQIAALWGYCAKRRYVERFPTLQQIRAPGRIPRGYTVEDVSALLRQAMRRRPPMKQTKHPHIFFPTLIRSCWETAERIGAHLALEWQDVDLVQRFIVFRAESRKGATRDIMRPISPDLALWLEQMRGAEGERVWHWVGDKTTLWYQFKKLCKAANVTNRGFHGLRKSAASYMALAGGDAAASQLLDHSSTAITKAHYIDVTIAKPKQTAIDLLPPLDLDGPRRDPPAN